MNYWNTKDYINVNVVLNRIRMIQDTVGSLPERTQGWMFTGVKSSIIILEAGQELFKNDAFWNEVPENLKCLSLPWTKTRARSGLGRALDNCHVEEKEPQPA